MIQISTKIPWFEIENAYIRGYNDETGAHKYPTVRELAEQYNVNPSSIQRYSKQEQWLLKRQQFTHRVREKATQKMIEEVSDESCDLNLKLFNIASKIADEIEEKLDEDISPKDLSVLSAALKNCQSVSASTLGDDKASDELTINVSLEESEE